MVSFQKISYKFWIILFSYKQLLRRECMQSRKDFERPWIGNVRLRQEVVNIWIFVFPAKGNSTDWEASTKKLVQIVLTLSLFFSAVPNFVLIFLSSSLIFGWFFSAGP